MPTLYYNNNGECYDAQSGGNLVEEYGFRASTSTVSLNLSKTSSTVPDLSQSITSETKVPSGHAGNASWSPTQGANVTITFDVPPQEDVEWGWDYDRATLPTPLKLRVRTIRV